MLGFLAHLKNEENKAQKKQNLSVVSPCALAGEGCKGSLVTLGYLCP